MKTVEEWFDILWKRVNHPAYGGETLMDIIGKIQREAAEEMRYMVEEWAQFRWEAEVKNRPDENIHKRTLDNTWKQVIREVPKLPLPGDDHDQT